MHPDIAPHQRKALKKIRSGSIVYGGVGTGKTRVALAYYVENESPKDILVLTTAKKRDDLDWQDEARLWDIGNIDGGPHGKITVDSWQNIKKYEDIEDVFLIADEQRVVGSGAWYKAFIKIAKKNRWILLSATPGDTWIDYVAVFVANGYYRNRSDFVQQHVIYSAWSKFPKIDRYVGTGKLVRHRNEVLVHMPYARHTTRHLRTLRVGHDADLLRRVVKDRWHVYEDRPIKNVSELFSVMRKVVNSDPSRMDTLRELMEKHPRVIVFYNFDYELELLRSLAENSPHGKSSGLTTSFVEGDSNRSRLEKEPSSVVKTTREDESCLKTNGKKSESQTPPKAWSDGTEQTPTPVDTTLSSEQQDAPSANCPFGGASPVTNSSLATSPTNGTTSTTSTTTCTCTSPTDVTIAEWNGHKHEPIPTSDRWIYLVQYTAGAEGWNCTTTDTVIFFSLNYSYKLFEQAQGRIDRLNTTFKDLNYYILKSDAAIDNAIMKALSEKKSFNERDFVPEEE